jgi:ATP-dependent Clp protease ATP-binding subunit ClpA
VLAALLRLLSEGILRDNDGNIADTRNAIVIMTSNFLSHEKERRPGFAPGGKTIDSSRPPEQAELRMQLEQHLQPKLIERLDAIVRFNQLEMDDLKKIAEQRIADVLKRVVASHAVTVDVASDVAEWLVSKAVAESPGARAIQRAVDSYLGNALGAFLNYEQGPGPGRIRVFVAHDAVQVESTFERR